MTETVQEFEHAYGRRPYDDSKAFLPFGEIRDAVTIPAHPATYDAISGWTGWKMLGNNAAGDCVAVTWATVRRIVTRIYGTENYPALAQVWKIYKTQNPDFDPNGTAETNGPGSSADQGMSIQLLLEYLVNKGGPDGVKALCFAKVDHTNVEEVKAALSIFNFLWTGINVTDTNENQFPSSMWTPSGQVLGGHSITSTGYDGDEIDGETWASRFRMALTYFTQGSSRGAGVEELWIVVWPEHAAHMTDAQKTALNTSYKALTGKDIVWGDVPAPGPFPGPTPQPQPPEPDPGVDSVLASALRRFAPHESCPNYLREAAESWLKTQP